MGLKRTPHTKHRRRRTASTVLALVAHALPCVAGYAWIDFEGENETKGVYAISTNTLGGLSWELNDVLIGTLDDDWKNGERAARFRGYSSSTMTLLEDLTNGIGRLSFAYRRYSSDTQRAWQVEYSIDSGVSWQPVGDSFIAPASDEVQTFHVDINSSDPARLRIRTAEPDGNSNRRLNIDDILITAWPTIATKPLVRTGALSDLAPTAVHLSGEVLFDGAHAITARGIVYSIDSEPTIENGHTVPAHNGDDTFTVEIADLIPGQPIHARAYAVNAVGPGYGTITLIETSFTNAPVALPAYSFESGGFTVAWTSVEGADHYGVELATDPFFTPCEPVELLRETFGTVTTATSIIQHHQNNGFDHNALIMLESPTGAPAEIRTTHSSSNNYTDPLGITASGEANVFFTQPGGSVDFGLAGIPLVRRDDLYIGFGYRKESGTAHAALNVEWTDDDVNWHTLTLDNLPESSGWHWVSHDDPIVAGQGSNSTLGVRWQKEADSETGFRIDDILIIGYDGSGSQVPGYRKQATAETELRITGLPPGQYYFRVKAVGAKGVCSPYSNIQSVGVSGGLILLIK